jgi:hypothetical protein
MGDRESRPQAGRSSAGDVADPSGIPFGDDFDLDADFDRWVADIEAGRHRIPEE